MHQEYTIKSEHFSKSQEKALNMIIKKEKEIKKIKNEITKILKENKLNNFDIETYKQNQQVEKL
ncbi:MAG TPA: hypothetical protein PKC87_00390 [Candidatus Absconditabacterales bacterium]|nr:hypothetical protein [Candidatus Absconditabacterales bacterium]